MNIDDARRFLTALQPHEKPFLFVTLDDSGKGSKRLLTERYSDLETHAGNLVRLNHEGAGTYVCVNRTDDSGRRKASNIIGVRALFVDLDGSPLGPTMASNPDIVVETSPDRFHVYWLVADCPMERW